MTFSAKSATLALFAAVSLMAAPSFGQVYAAKTGSCRFFSTTPVEDIEATATAFSTGINATTKQLIVVIPMKSFVFKKSLMREHFLENYVEAEKYPQAKFSGTMSDFDPKSTSPQQITATGDLTIHGVTKKRTIKGTVKNVGGKLIMDGKFSVELAEHGVTIPSAVGNKIAETVEITFKSELTPSKGKK